MDIIKKAWRGEEKLWKVYWLYSVLGGIAVSVMFGVVLNIVAALLGLGPVHYIGIAFMLAFYVWSTVSIWRCAWNVKVKFWGYLVRIFIVLGLIGLATQIVQLVTAPPKAPASMTSTLTVTAPTAMDDCEKRMTDYAVQNNADPKAYIAQNQTYLQQCRQTLAAAAPAPVAAATSAPAAVPNTGPCPANWLGHNFHNTYKRDTQDVCDYADTVTDAECSGAGAMSTSGPHGSFCQKIEQNGTILLSITRQ